MILGDLHFGKAPFRFGDVNSKINCFCTGRPGDESSPNPAESCNLLRETKSGIKDTLLRALQILELLLPCHFEEDFNPLTGSQVPGSIDSRSYLCDPKKKVSEGRNFRMFKGDVRPDLEEMW
jgi:hypothetical protein